MQQSPNRENIRLSRYHIRTKRKQMLADGSLTSNEARTARIKRNSAGWITTIACRCCSMNDAKLRHWQKRLSKAVTLRSHRG